MMRVELMAQKKVDEEWKLSFGTRGWG